MGSKVFISYRREDARWPAIAIETVLEDLLGPGNVFRDLSGIAPGSNWRMALDQALDESEATLVVIGPHWLDVQDPETGARCLDRETDFVRYEIVRSLERAIPVVPVLLDGVALPEASDLPADLAELIERQGVQIDYRTCKADIHDLVSRLGLRADSSAGTPAADVSRGTAPIEARISGAGTGETEPSLQDLLERFLGNFRQWSFSATRIANWGAQQGGYERLGHYGADAIRSELKRMVDLGLAETRTSKKGGTLYRPAKP